MNLIIGNPDFGQEKDKQTKNNISGVEHAGKTSQQQVHYRNKD